MQSKEANSMMEKLKATRIILYMTNQEWKLFRRPALW